MLLTALLAEGCVFYPPAAPIHGQSTATLERDRRECAARAADAVEPPLLAGLRQKALFMLGGALVGAGAAAGAVGEGTSDPKEFGLIVGVGAAAGLVAGAVVGTLKGSDEVSRVARIRHEVFAECMTERGYKVEREL